MPPLVCVGDICVGVCPAHTNPQGYTGTFVTGNPIVKGATPGIAVGDVAVATCGHPVVALSGSAITNLTGKPAHRVGDVGTNPGPCVSMTGNPKIMVK